MVLSPILQLVNNHSTTGGDDFTEFMFNSMYLFLFLFLSPSIHFVCRILKIVYPSQCCRGDSDKVRSHDFSTPQLSKIDEGGFPHNDTPVPFLESMVVNLYEFSGSNMSPLNNVVVICPTALGDSLR